LGRAVVVLSSGFIPLSVIFVCVAMAHHLENS
jgi:hypothetical protein